MALDYFLKNGVQQQLDIIQSVARALINPPSVNLVGQLTSLFNVLGVVSRKNTVGNMQKAFVNSRIPPSPPIETIKGVGKKLGGKLREVGINTISDLKQLNPATFKIQGISQSRIEKWQNMV